MSAVAMSVLAYIPSPERGVWMLGPIPIRAYALCIIAGIVVAVTWGERRFIARGGESGVVTDVAVYAVPFGLVGGRLYHVATDWPKYFGPGANPIDALKVWQGGLGIWGAVALGAVGALIGCRRRGVPLPFFADAVAPCIVVAQAIGRLGNWFNQELYGGPTTLPWGLEIYRRVDPATGASDALTGVVLDPTPIAIVHPTFLYELLWNLGVAALVVWADRRFRLGHGRAFAVYVAGYTAGRFWIELMRSDPATLVFGNIRINVVVSVVVFLGAVLYLVVVRKPREVLSRPVPAAADRVPAAVIAATKPAAAEPAAGVAPLSSPSAEPVAAVSAEPDTVAVEAAAVPLAEPDPVAVEPAAAAPGEPDTVAVEPAAGSPVAPDPVTVEPAVVASAEPDPVAVESATAAPAEPDTVVVEPAAAVPAESDPAAAESSGVTGTAAGVEDAKPTAGPVTDLGTASNGAAPAEPGPAPAESSGVAGTAVGVEDAKPTANAVTDPDTASRGATPAEQEPAAADDVLLTEPEPSPHR